MPRKISKGSKMEHHPDKEEITQRFMAGDSIRAVFQWLNAKYAKGSKHNKLSMPTLLAYRKGVMKLDGKVLKDIQDAKREQDKALELQYTEQLATSSNAYQDKINQIASQQLDVAARILQMDAVVGDRIEHWYNLIKSGEQLPAKADNELRKYVDQQLLILQQYRKLVEGMADKRVDYNVNITVMNEQIHSIQGVIQDLICEEMGPEKAIEFLGKLSDRLNPGATKELTGPIQDVKFMPVNDA
jgi:hypothetical protein